MPTETMPKQVSTNSLSAAERVSPSQIVVIFVAILLGWPLPLAALPILWLNVVTNVLPAFALALEASAPDIMRRPPRDPRQPLVSLQFVWLITWQGFLLAGVTLLAFVVGMHWHGSEGEGLRQATTMAFMTLALAQIFHAFSARSQRRSAFTNLLFTNGWLWAAVGICVILQVAAAYVPLLQKVLHTVPPTISDWGVIAACSLMPVAVVEFVKVVQRVAIRSAPALKTEGTRTMLASASRTTDDTHPLVGRAGY